MLLGKPVDNLFESLQTNLRGGKVSRTICYVILTIRLIRRALDCQGGCWRRPQRLQTASASRSNICAFVFGCNRRAKIERVVFKIGTKTQRPPSPPKRSLGRRLQDRKQTHTKRDRKSVSCNRLIEYIAHYLHCERLGARSHTPPSQRTLMAETAWGAARRKADQTAYQALHQHFGRCPSCCALKWQRWRRQHFLSILPLCATAAVHLCKQTQSTAARRKRKMAATVMIRYAAPPLCVLSSVNFRLSSSRLASNQPPRPCEFKRHGVIERLARVFIGSLASEELPLATSEDNSNGDSRVWPARRQ